MLLVSLQTYLECEKQVTCTHLRWVEFQFENLNFLKILFFDKKNKPSSPIIFNTKDINNSTIPRKQGLQKQLAINLITNDQNVKAEW